MGEPDPVYLLDNVNASEHLIQPWNPGGGALAASLARYLGEGLRNGDAAVLMAIEERREAVLQRIAEGGVDTAEAVRDGRMILLDADEEMAKMCASGPDWAQVERDARELANSLLARPDVRGIRIYGEMCGMFWKAGDFESALQLEHLWHKVICSSNVSAVCGYPIDIFDESFQMARLDPILCTHTHLVPSSNNLELESAIHRAMDDTLGERALDLRPLMKPNFRPSWAAIPRAEAAILWLRKNLPDVADQILARARQYYQPA
jgi:MEDS: MEthanogen/methylotroph, DcmR Sensory domain